MRIFLGTPTGGRLHHRTLDSAERDLASGVVTQWRRSAGPFVSMNRNALLSWFLKSDAEAMVQVDDDVAWGAGTLEHLTAYLDGHPVVFSEMPDRQMDTNAYAWTPELSEAPYNPEPHEVSAFGAGLFAVSRAFALTLPPFPFDLVQHGGYQRREDLSFSLLIAGLGVRPLCVPGLDVLHYSAERALRPRRA
jgi:hypothetical protein